VLKGGPRPARFNPKFQVPEQKPPEEHWKLRQRFRFASEGRLDRLHHNPGVASLIGSLLGGGGQQQKPKSPASGNGGDEGGGGLGPATGWVSASYGAALKGK
jgi:hypothetical protein